MKLSLPYFHDLKNNIMFVDLKQPFVSIITVVYNAEKTIEKTILSVTNQKPKLVEYIIIDGGSTDGTLEIIKKHKNGIDYWISEKDNGIYDAMNKGISIAKGRYINFINSGDLLLKLPIIDTVLPSDILAYPVMLSNSKIFLPYWGKGIKTHNTLPHQGCFYKKCDDLKFNVKYKVFADFALNQQYFKKNKEIKTFNSPVVAIHDINGISHDKKFAKEIFIVVNDNFGFCAKIKSWLYFKFEGLKKRIKDL